MDMTTQTSFEGPVFDGRAAKAGADFAEEASRAIAEAGASEVRTRLGSAIQNSTGTYIGSITVDSLQSDHLITDGGMVYGPWLEGVASRNQRSRFKGYSVFRRTKQWLAGQATDIAEGKIRPYLSRMGGE